MSDYIERIVKRSSDLLGTDVPPDGQEIFSVLHERWHHLDWRGLLQEIPELINHINRLWKTHDFVGDFYEDLYNLLIQGVPLMRDKKEMRDDRSVTYSITEELHQDPATEGLRLNTRYDPYSTAMAILSMKDKLDAAFSKMEEQERLSREMADARAAVKQAMKDLVDMLRQLAQGLQKAENAEGGSDEQQEGAGQANAALDALDGLGQALEDALNTLGVAVQSSKKSGEQIKDAIGSEIKDAMNQASQELQDEADLMHSYGIDDGTLKKMDFAERRDLARRLKTGRMADFSQLIGAFRLIQIGERRRKVIHGIDEVVGVTTGNDLAKLTPASLVQLVDELEDVFWLKFVESSLEVYETKGWERLGRGPIIVVGDESGSMTYGLGDHTREAWMKGFALALAQQARDERREFVYIGFSSYRQHWIKTFPDGIPDLAGIVEIAEHFWGGGTHYEAPLLAALEIVEEQGRLKKPKADVVFITDDEYGDLDEEFMARWAAARDELSMRCYGIAVGATSDGCMKQISDDVREIGSFNATPDKVADIFRMV